MASRNAAHGVNVAAAGDNPYVIDKGLRRIARVDIGYRETRAISFEQ